MAHIVFSREPIDRAGNTHGSANIPIIAVYRSGKGAHIRIPFAITYGVALLANGLALSFQIVEFCFANAASEFLRPECKKNLPAGTESKRQPLTFDYVETDTE